MNNKVAGKIVSLLWNDIINTLPKDDQDEYWKLAEDLNEFE